MGLFGWNFVRSWRQGRQNSGYEHLNLFNSELLKCDCYLIRYKVGDSIPWHRDSVGEYYNHFRMNITLRKAEEGGEFECRKLLYQRGRIVIFRPDVEPHAVTPVVKGRRYVLSFGWKRRKKQ